MNSFPILRDDAEIKTEEKNPLAKVKHLIAVGAGKGGVGKSSVTVLLALALQKRGYRVGILDADVYGPSLDQMIPCETSPRQSEEDSSLLLPGIGKGISLISTAHFRTQAAIVRAPIANEMIEVFLKTIDWGELDFLLLDFPPGTGDIHLTLMQKAPISAALVVTTPQEVSILDVRKAIELFESMHIPLLGVVENMSFFLEQERMEKHYLFGKGGGERLAAEKGLSFLGEIPLDPQISFFTDRGRNLFEEAPNAAGTIAFTILGDKIIKAMESTISFDPSKWIKKGADGSLAVEQGGEWKSLTASMIQAQCPCVACRALPPGDKKEGKTVSLLEFSFLGRYALRIKFSVGCSRGIYPLALLKELTSQGSTYN